LSAYEAIFVVVEAITAYEPETPVLRSISNPSSFDEVSDQLNETCDGETDEAVNPLGVAGTEETTTSVPILAADAIA
jgi:hypothetical protein